MYLGGGEVRSPIVGAVPTALLADGGFHVKDDSLPGLGRPLRADGGTLVPTPSPGNQEPALLQAQPEVTVASPAYLYELGLTTAAMGFHTAAIEALRNCTARAPDHAAAWRKLAELLRLAKEDAQAEAAEAVAERVSSGAGKWKMATGERVLAKLEKAESKLREKLRGTSPEEAAVALRNHLVVKPRDAVAMRLLAQLERLAGDGITSLLLLERALELSPSYIGARENYAELLVERRLHAAAAAQTARLLAHDPRNAHYRSLHAHTMIYIGNLDEAIDILAGLLRENTGQPRYWLAYAQALHFIGRRDESVQAFRQCLELKPDLGEAYWGLANLKGNFITEADIAAIRAQLEEAALQSDGRMHMLYALAHALERSGDFAASFAAYDEGARLFRAVSEKRRTDNARPDPPNGMRRLKTVFSRENLEAKLVQAPAASPAVAPIFIVGMPRAGSTLVEQILASHSQVEGTRELPLIGDITRDLSLSRMMVVPDAYPECVLDLTRQQLAALGARYIERARDYRKTERRYFVDKRPWNWQEVGLIQLILPHAKIIDIRREPMAACFAMFKQVLPIDAAFSYDLDSLGIYYNKYVSMMEHWQSALPGRVHFVQYERLVEDTESEVRRMLDYCGLPFEEDCLRFWETDRAVSTPSAEQVRRPIYRDALEQWRKFEPWLGPLRQALNRPVEA
jgi:tetratricopeptide (TPR) repeat protein